MRLSLTTTLLLLVVTAGCGPASSPTNLPTGDSNALTLPGANTSPAPGFQADAPAWTHMEKVSAPGSKSERRDGQLWCNGQQVGGDLGELITPIGRFVYGTGMWGAVHWQIRPAAFSPGVNGATTAVAVVTGAPFTPSDAAKGWYESRWPEVRPGTPGHWCYAVKPGMWVDPARAADLARASGLAQQPDPFDGLAPGNEPPVVPAGCFHSNVVGSWTAWIDLMPPGPRRICVSGKVRMTRPGCAARLEFVELMKSFPPVLVLRLKTTDAGERSDEALTVVDVNYNSDRNVEAGSIQILFPDGTREDIKDIGEAR